MSPTSLWNAGIETIECHGTFQAILMM